MNCCPSCNASDFSFRELHKASFNTPAKCKNCGSQIARYHFSQPFFNSLGAALGSAGLFIILFWGVYIFLFLIVGTYIFSYVFEYIEAYNIKLKLVTDISKSQQNLISIGMHLLGAVFSIMLFFETIRRL
ncbi:hypothetical protein [Candidatus Albibeggiatoa sp. nov. NOAA]|uniref:hypothetical protein n=1 Tax=Candidatus Albibeggiatoa sp. nov. NOAA TaxID=3162724 RepID=UPI0032FA2891|nr:hypothetical protein [Thiotrichaceae bacterium]